MHMLAVGSGVGVGLAYVFCLTLLGGLLLSLQHVSVGGIMPVLWP